MKNINDLRPSESITVAADYYGISVPQAYLLHRMGELPAQTEVKGRKLVNTRAMLKHIGYPIPKHLDAQTYESAEEGNKVPKKEIAQLLNQLSEACDTVQMWHDDIFANCTTATA